MSLSRIARGAAPILTVLVTARAACPAPFLTVVQVVQGLDGLGGVRSVALSPDGTQLYIASANDDAVVVFRRDGASGELTLVEQQKDGVNGVDGLNDARAVLVSPDRLNVYAASAGDDAVAVFRRDPTTGGLTYVERHRDGVAKVNGLNGAAALALSPEAATLYVAGASDDALAVFQRDPTTGALTFLAQVKEGVGGVDGLAGARSVAVSPDGAHVYAAGTDDQAVAVFRREPATGALSFVEVVRNGVAGVDGLKGVRAVALSADGAELYAAGSTDNAIVAFRRDPATGTLGVLQVVRNGLGRTQGLGGVRALALDPEGLHLYATSGSDDALTVFRRDPATGVLLFTEEETDGEGPVTGLKNAAAVAISPDARFLYVAGAGDDAVTVFRLPHLECTTAPATSCRAPAESRKAFMVLRQVKRTQRDRLAWRWSAPAASPTFASPLSGTDYALCLYDASDTPGSPGLAFGAYAPATSGCAGGKPCWTAHGHRGFRYQERSDNPAGLLRIVLGTTARGRTRIAADGGGASFTGFGLPLTPTVTLQLQNAGGGCWGAEYQQPIRNQLHLFKARSG